MLTVVFNLLLMLNVVMLNVIMLNVVMLHVVMLNVVMLNVVMLNVEAPLYAQWCYNYLYTEALRRSA